MAVSRMRRIQILAHTSAKEEVIAALREEGVLHVVEPAVEFDSEMDHDARIERERGLVAELSKLEYVRTFLKPYVPKGKPFEKMFNPRVLVDRSAHADLVAGFDAEKLYQRCVELEGRMRSAEAEIQRKSGLIAELGHWAGLGGPVESFTDTRNTRVSLVSFEGADTASLERELSDESPETALIEVSRSGAAVYAVAIYMKADEQAVAPVLKRNGARSVDLAGTEGRPEDAIESLRNQIDETRASIESMREEAEELARRYDDVLVIVDERAESLGRQAIEEHFAATRETFVLEGWIRGRDEKRVRERLAATTPNAHIYTRDPEKGEQIPIDLHNGKVVSPFEFVTTLYGRPVYWEFDPTPLLAPFFIVFFGLCVSDGGYGVTLAALSFFLMKKMQPGGGRKLMQLMFMGGISTAVVGAITGGWFGIDPEVLPSFVRAAIVMNPLDEPMKMLNVVFILGIVQIFTGLAIQMVADFKEGRWLDGVLDQLVWILFLTFLVPLGYNFILGGDVSPGLSAAATRGALVMGGVVVLTGARKNKNPIMKVLGGVLKLYDVVNYFGDVLSYARLLALGLATGAIAMAINGVAQMAMGIPIVGIVVAVLVLIGGHIFNIAVNCLGGFVHSGRLQYLEYFSKFFTGGGRSFEPFRVERKYSTIED